MTSAPVPWSAFAHEQPELAARVRACFDLRRHATVATLRVDGAPRISGTEVAFTADGELRLGSMPGARKALDLQRDPRVAVHSPTVDPPEDDPSSWAGEAKVSGVVVERAVDRAHAFDVQLTSAVHTTVEGDELVITLWRCGRAVETMRRA